MNEVQYNKLVHGPFTVPRYLFVVVVPAVAESFVGVQTEGLLLRHLGYFHSFEGETAISDPVQHRHPPVKVSLRNVLTVRSLLGLVHRDLEAGFRLS